MYKTFYNLTSKPFQISSDPEFLWLGEKHKEALAILKYGILDNRGFLLLTGDVGTGKTTLIHALLNSLGDDIVRASVPDPSLEQLDFCNYIAAGFGMHQGFKSKGSFLIQFSQFLKNAHRQNKRVLLIIDEAQLLTQELLEEVRLLSNIEKAEVKLLNIFFVGQNEFNEKLAKHQNRAVRQRITINYNIDTLSREETVTYVKHRLKVAGTTDDLFTPGAFQEIYRHSEGFPRRINIICDHALLTGYVKETKRINGAIVQECSKEVTLPVTQPKKPARPRLTNQHSHASVRQSVAAPTMPKPASPKKAVSEKGAKNSILKFCIFLALAAALFYGYLFMPDTLKKFNIVSDRKPSGLTAKDTMEQKTIMDHTDLKVTKGDESKNKPTVVPDKKVSLSPGEVIKHAPGDQVGQPGPDGGTLSLKPEGSGAHGMEEKDASGIDSGEKQDKHSIAETGPSKIKAELENLLEVPKDESSIPGKTIVRFNSNTTQLTDQGLNSLAALIKIIQQYPDTSVVVKGFSDSSGYYTQNLKLSESRALAVKEHLIRAGVSAHRVITKGMGSINPIVSNETASGRMVNRRVEIEILKNSL